MFKTFTTYIKNIDWFLLTSVLLICAAGLVTMRAFLPVSLTKNAFFSHQLIWLTVALIVFFVSSSLDWRFLKDTRLIMILYGVSVGLLTLLFLLGKVSHGAQSWFSFGGFAFQPVDLSELVAIIVLAKYFSRRHVEIAYVRHILVSGFYILIIFFLVFLQPDFGAAMIIFFLWLGMLLVSGISKKHLFSVFAIGIVVFFVMWGFIFKPYQKDRILNFIHPLTNIRGSGYNAYQSTIAVGSGQLIGKGIGYGTQSRLQYLPEYQTDFVFAAFAEEWGFIGVILLFILFGIVFARILGIASKAGSNFDTLFAYGVAILLMVHAAINVGTNIGLLPVTGNTLPFMSYGGSHLVTEFLSLGILMAMKRYGRAAGKEITQNEIVGVT